MITVMVAIWGAVTGTLSMLFRLADWWEKRKAEQLDGDFEGEADWREPVMLLHVRFRNRGHTPQTIELADLEFGPASNRRHVSAVYESDLAYVVEPNTTVRYGELREQFLVLPLVVPRQDVARGPMPFWLHHEDYEAWGAMTRRDRRVLRLSYDGKELRIVWP